MEGLKELLREVLKEELVPIKEQLAEHSVQLENINKRMDKLESRMDKLESRIDKLEGRMDTSEGQMRTVIEKLDRIERNQAEDVVGILKLMNEKLTALSSNQDNKIEVLNQRVFKLEADMRKLIAP